MVKYTSKIEHTKAEFRQMRTVYLVMRQQELNQTVWAVCLSPQKAVEVVGDAESDELLGGKFVIEDWKVI